MKIICTAIILLSTSLALAHGEDKPGPSGGHIRMPGGFHTELTLDDHQGAHIFLLDMNFKNPTVKDSEIKMKFVSGKKEVPFSCSIMGGNHFHCVPKSQYASKGELKIIATREKAVGQEVTYKLPLEKFETKKMDHSGH